MSKVYCPVCWKELVINTDENSVREEEIIVFCANSHKPHKMWLEEEAKEIREENGYGEQK